MIFIFAVVFPSQDMVERALVDEIADERVASPGVYLHQMPYPCYKKDRYAHGGRISFQYSGLCNLSTALIPRLDSYILT